MYDCLKRSGFFFLFFTVWKYKTRLEYEHPLGMMWVIIISPDPAVHQQNQTCCSDHVEKIFVFQKNCINNLKTKLWLREIPVNFERCLIRIQKTQKYLNLRWKTSNMEISWYIFQFQKQKGGECSWCGLY